MTENEKLLKNLEELPETILEYQETSEPSYYS